MRLPVIAAVLLLAGAAAAQTTTYDIRSGEVLSVQGNHLVVRGPNGVREFNIAEDFRFDLDGKQLSVHELKPGMKLTALIRTTETPVELTTTELRNAEVIQTLGSTIVVRNLETGQYKKFTNEEMKDIDLVIYKDGQVVDPSSLRKGDKVSAIVVTKLPPATITEQDIAVMAQNAPPPKAAPAATAPAPKAEVPPPPPPPQPKLPKTGSSLPVIALFGVAALSVGATLTLWRKLAR